MDAVFSDSDAKIATSLAIDPAANFIQWLRDVFNLFTQAMNAHFVFGLIHLIVDDATYATYPGRDNPKPNPPAAGVLDADAASGTVAIWKKVDDLHIQYRTHAMRCRQELISSLGPTIRKAIGNRAVGGTITLTSQQIIAAVTALFGTNTGVDVKAFADVLEEPITGQTKAIFIEFVSRFTDAVENLATARQPIPMYLQLEKFQVATSAQPAIARAYQVYIDANPTLNQQTLSNAVTAITASLSNVTVAQGGFVAATAAASQGFAGGSVPSIDYARLAELVAEQMKIVAKTTRGGKPPGGGKTTTYKGPLYCYCHGYKNHAGSACTKMEAANKSAPGTYSAKMLNATAHTDVPGGAT